MIVISADLPWGRLGQFHRRPEQSGEPVLELLLEDLRLGRPDLIGAGARRFQQQNAQGKQTKRAHWRPS
jgi:hypothetical protein